MKTGPTLQLRHPANARALRYLAESARPGEVPFRRPRAGEDPYMDLGSHPDVVELLWDGLGEAFAGKARGIVYGTPALIAPRCGVLLAVALGTAYAIRLAPEAYAAAMLRGAETRHTYRRPGTTLDLAEEFGLGWIFGGFEKEEKALLAAVAELFVRE
ncbi:MAG TPA: hypothetical protein VFI25_04110 [Planctomycetota bacterium]|nr:hypothetical protein [Planctomycetota bacterium]